MLLRISIFVLIEAFSGTAGKSTEPLNNERGELEIFNKTKSNGSSYWAGIKVTEGLHFLGSSKQA